MQEKILQQPVYGTITLYGLTIPDEIQPTNKRIQIKSIHHISTHVTVRDSVCSVSVSLAVTNDIAILLSLPPPTKMFQFGGFPILNGSANQSKDYLLGSPIRQSWVQKMYAPRPSLSQLTTTFIGSQAKPSPRQYKVAYILNNFIHQENN